MTLTLLLLGLAGAPPQAGALEPAGEVAAARAPSSIAQDPPKKEVEPFPKLRGRSRKLTEDALLTLRRGKKPEHRQEAAAQLAEVGRGAVPLIIEGAFRFEEPRIAGLLAALDGCLDDADLHLAWEVNEGLGEKRLDLRVRRFLVRRWAESGREDAAERLAAWLASEDEAIRYAAARGLAFRGERDAVPVLHAYVQAHWARNAASIRKDFAGIERGPLSATASSMINRGDTKQRVAGVHVFELLGIEEHAKMLLDPLKDSDYSLRLAAINACRVVVADDEPLKKPSVFEQVERAQKWQERLND